MAEGLRPLQKRKERGKKKKKETSKFRQGEENNKTRKLNEKRPWRPWDPSEGEGKITIAKISISCGAGKRIVGSEQKEGKKREACSVTSGVEPERSPSSEKEREEEKRLFAKSFPKPKPRPSRARRGASPPSSPLIVTKKKSKGGTPILLSPSEKKGEVGPHREGLRPS